MTATGRVLVIYDNEVECRSLCQSFKSAGFTVFAADDADKALGYLGEDIDVVVCEIARDNSSALDLLAHWKRHCSGTKVILVAGHGTVIQAVQAIKAGAYDYVAKPQSLKDLVLLARHVMDLTRKEADFSNARQLDPKYPLEQLVGQSAVMKQVLARIERAAPVDSTVLILGENGTGKELVALALHHGSPRRNGPFVPINVSAVPASLIESELFGHVRGAFTGATDRRVGRFDQAHGGTLFIDEIGDFDLALQPKLLRVLETLTLTPVGGHEDHTVNVRVIAATSRNVMQMVQAGTFREDLFYRLNVVRINLPPLRERREDIPALADCFVRRIAARNRGLGRKLAAPLIQHLVDYHWPGNVRELHNTLESMMVLAERELLTEADLPEHILHAPAALGAAPEPSVGLTIEELEKLAIVRALQACAKNRTRAAARLGISVRTLQRKLLAYQID